MRTLIDPLARSQQRITGTLGTILRSKTPWNICRFPTNTHTQLVTLPPICAQYSALHHTLNHARNHGFTSIEKQNMWAKQHVHLHRRCVVFFALETVKYYLPM
jgi:hypothetical protein